MTDRDANKAALCSAVFAGFAYVGYTLFRQQLERQPGARHTRKDRGFLLRRLSQSRADLSGHDGGGGGGDGGGDGDDTVSLSLVDGNGGGGGGGDGGSGRGGTRLVFTSVSVQQRIKQLNRQARQFAETMMVVQQQQTRRPHGVAPHRSSQCTPWQTPRTLSPLCFHVLSTSQSSDHLALSPHASTSSLTANTAISAFLTAPRQNRRQRRDTVDSDASSSSAVALVAGAVAGGGGGVAIELSQQDWQCLRDVLDSGGNRVLTCDEARVLVAMLRAVADVNTVRRTLVTIANCCAFTSNQEVLREAGVVPLLTAHLLHPCPAVQMAASQAASNLALNENNQSMMQDCVEVLLSLLDSEDNSVREAVLSCLVNVTALDRWHMLFTPHLSFLYALLDVAPPGVQLQSLRLLVNLSCNDTMVPCLLAARAPDRLLRHLSAHSDTSRLLRVLTLFANLAGAVHRLHIDPSTDLPADHKAPAPDTVYARLLGASVRHQLLARCQQLAGAGLPDHSSSCGGDDQLLEQLQRLTQAVTAVINSEAGGGGGSRSRRRRR